MSTPAPSCKGSQRIVSKAARKASVWVGGSWRYACPVCGHGVTWRRTSQINKRGGYVCRYDNHEITEADQ